jgi:hypothetical protein
MPDFVWCKSAVSRQSFGSRGMSAMPQFEGALFDLIPETWLLAQQTDATWFDKLLSSNDLSEMIFFGFLTLVIIVPSLAGVWYKTRVKEWETSLKQTMLERGMSAEEIRTVLDAGGGRAAGRCGSAHRAKSHDPNAAIQS